MENQVQEILDYYSKQRDRHEQAVIVEMLRELQEAEGFITPELVEQAAQTAGVSASFIKILIHTYPSLKEAPYKHEIVVCTGGQCGNKAGLLILQKIREELGIEKDGLSADGQIMLKTRGCLKQCRTAPNFYLDGKLCSCMTPEAAVKILREL
jgi:NADH:ubiquinone oxidoreductase subunit E